MCKHNVDNAYYISRGIWVKKWPLRSFKDFGNGAIRYATYDFLLAFHYSYVSITLIPRYYHLLLKL